MRREIHTLLAAAIIALLGYLTVREVVPDLPSGLVVPVSGSMAVEATTREVVPDLSSGLVLAWLGRFIGPAWPFFAGVALLLLYAAGAWLAEWRDYDARRDWRSLVHALQWATEASPMVGLLQTFVSMVVALNVLSEEGQSDASRSAFVAEFSTALGSTIAGMALALGCFTLNKLVTR